MLRAVGSRLRAAEAAGKLVRYGARQSPWKTNPPKASKSSPAEEGLCAQKPFFGISLVTFFVDRKHVWTARWVLVVLITSVVLCFVLVWKTFD